MDKELACFRVTPSKVAVVDVDVVKTHLEESLRTHGGGLTLDDLFTDVEGEGVPRTPTHCGLIGNCLCIASQPPKGEG